MGIDTEIYTLEYNWINGDMEDLHNKRSVLTQAEITRREALDNVKDIDRILRGKDNVKKFGEGLFKVLVEHIRVLNLVQVEFVLRIGVGIIEILG